MHLGMIGLGRVGANMVRRRGSVIGSWLLDLTAMALFEQSVLSAALYQRFSSRGEEDLADKLLSAMRFQFGGHVERRA